MSSDLFAVGTLFLMYDSSILHEVVSMIKLFVILFFEEFEHLYIGCVIVDVGHVLRVGGWHVYSSIMHG